MSWLLMPTGYLRLEIAEMSDSASLSQDDFDRLLQWLGSDRDTAAAKYREVHRKLTRLFAFKGCNCPEDLADEVIDRVAKKLPDLPPQEAGDPNRVFYAFSKFVYLEHSRERIPIDASVNFDGRDEDADLEKQHQCLDLCLEKLEKADRHLLLLYYRYSPGEKIPHRRAIAEEQQIGMNALRIKICRLRSRRRGLHHTVRSNGDAKLGAMMAENERLQNEEQLRRYLLGQCSPNESDEVELAMVSEGEVADLLAVLEDELTEDYVSGALNDSERAAFERQFLNNQRRRRKTWLSAVLLGRQDVVEKLKHGNPGIGQDSSGEWSMLNAPVTGAQAGTENMGFQVDVWSSIFGEDASEETTAGEETENKNLPSKGGFWRSRTRWLAAGGAALVLTLIIGILITPKGHKGKENVAVSVATQTTASTSTPSIASVTVGPNVPLGPPVPRELSPGDHTITLGGKPGRSGAEPAKEGAIELKLDGAGFERGAIVHWNGSALPTTFVDSSHLVAYQKIDHKQIGKSGFRAEVSVLNPPPGSRTSMPVSITVKASDLR